MKNSILRRKAIKTAAFFPALGLMLAFPVLMSADTIMVGSISVFPTGQVESVSLGGSVLGFIGPTGATAAAVDNNGNPFYALPAQNFSSTTIQEYDAAQNLLGQFTFVAPVDTQGGASHVVDMTWGFSSLWVSTYSGFVYQLTPSTGYVLQSFDTGVSLPGVTTDSQYLYTTAGSGLGDTAPFILPAGYNGRDADRYAEGHGTAPDGIK